MCVCLHPKLCPRSCYDGSYGMEVGASIGKKHPLVRYTRGWVTRVPEVPKPGTPKYRLPGYPKVPFTRVPQSTLTGYPKVHTRVLRSLPNTPLFPSFLPSFSFLFYFVRMHTKLKANQSHTYIYCADTLTVHFFTGQHQH